MGAVQGFEDLEVWKKSVDFAEAVCRVSSRWPADERYGLTQQARRAAAFVAANVAEGAERNGTREFLHFLGIAKGSLAEARTFMVLANRLHYIEQSEAGELNSQATELGRMLSGLVRALQSKL